MEEKEEVVYNIVLGLDEEEGEVVVKEIVVDIVVGKGKPGRIGLILEGHLEMSLWLFVFGVFVIGKLRNI